MPRKDDYPETVPLREQYTAGQVAILFGVSHRTACNMIDRGELPGFRAPGTQVRRVLLSSIKAYVVTNPQYAFILSKIKGLS